MNQPVVFMYPGQGSQYYHMGIQLYKHNDVFRVCMDTLNDQVYGLIGESVLDIIYDPGRRVGERFDRTLYTHIAIFMVECSLTKIFLSHGIEPNAVIGTSLGEYAATVTAGVWSMETALQAVVRQAELLESTCAEGGMLAILHNLNIYSSDPLLRELCELAAVNHQSHFIVSGSARNIDRVEQLLKSKEVVCLRLAVSHGFHSSCIDPAEKPYLSYVQEQILHKPVIPYGSSVYGKIIGRLEPDYFWKVARKPIRFAEAVSSITHEQKKGIYIDMGPSGTLVNIVKNLPIYNQKQTALSIMTPFHKDCNQLDDIIRRYADSKENGVC
ncbi:acyltransferase domain-containing protein [Paenibacillus sp. FSL L8-0689]|uniref:acyltransferase domain-containing protein n=1 Tax=Paenibacillus sp. FSL L8-0689 TaxID=2921607 RepID=UPI0030F7832C